MQKNPGLRVLYGHLFKIEQTQVKEDGVETHLALHHSNFCYGEDPNSLQLERKPSVFNSKS